MKFILDAITSKAYWQYVLLSKPGVESVLSILGVFWLIVSMLDFFGLYGWGKGAPYVFLVLVFLSIAISIALRLPRKSICVSFPQKDLTIEVRIDNLFDTAGAIMISTNTDFEGDVSGGKIALDSLQGQFTDRYFKGNQNELLSQMLAKLQTINGSAPFPLGTTIPITTHGKTFYFTAMSELNDRGNASTTQDNVIRALEGLWSHVRNAGELQDALAVPVVGTGRGRLTQSRKKMISLIAQSFANASENGKLADTLIIVIRPEDAANFKLNLYDVKNHLTQVLHCS